MEHNAGTKTFGGQLARRRNYFRPEKEKAHPTRNYLEVLGHYYAELIQSLGRITIVNCETGAELPLDQRAKLLMVKQLLDEFGTIDKINQAVDNYKAPRFFALSVKRPDVP